MIKKHHSLNNYFIFPMTGISMRGFSSKSVNIFTTPKIVPFIDLFSFAFSLYLFPFLIVVTLRIEKSTLASTAD